MEEQVVVEILDPENLYYVQNLNALYLAYKNKEMMKKKKD